VSPAIRVHTSSDADVIQLTRAGSRRRAANVSIPLPGLARALLVTIVLLALAGAAPAQTIEGCIDAAGVPVPSVEDDALPSPALAGTEGGRTILRYNPGALPRLSPQARTFFYAHECARIALGVPLAVERTAEAARRADCQAVAILRESKLLDGGEAMTKLESELRFSDAEWKSIPGPRRDFRLADCTARGVLRLPDSAPPGEARLRHDRCVQICGDRLWQCQNACREPGCRAGCESGFGRCESACGPQP
jgi:hypothetical protein